MPQNSRNLHEYPYVHKAHELFFNVPKNHKKSSNVPKTVQMSTNVMFFHKCHQNSSNVHRGPKISQLSTDVP